MKTEFEEPVVEVVYFDAEDVIVTSTQQSCGGGKNELPEVFD